MLLYYNYTVAQPGNFQGELNGNARKSSNGRVVIENIL